MTVHQLSVQVVAAPAFAAAMELVAMTGLGELVLVPMVSVAKLLVNFRVPWPLLLLVLRWQGQPRWHLLEGLLGVRLADQMEEVQQVKEPEQVPWLVLRSWLP